jgi:hypothetical protein
MVFTSFVMNVLLIEDDRRIAGLVERGLKEDDHCVSTSYDGREGAEMMLEGRYDKRARFQEALELYRQFSDEAQHKISSHVRELEARISNLPRGIKAGFDPQPILQ